MGVGGPSESVVYAEQLSLRGYGYPLWDPNPTRDVDDADELQEVRIGDVGYLIDGAFRRLFNVVAARDDPANKGGLPEGFAPLKFNRRLVYARDNFLPPGPICSMSVVLTNTEGNLGGGVDLANASASYKFACQSNQGAVLLLKDHAHKETVAPNRTFTAYLRENYDRWRAWATSELGLDDKQDLVLVRGWVKTTQWALTAWAEKSAVHGVALQVTGAHLVQAGVSATYLQAESTGAPTTKSGPLGVDPADMKPNQCVFLSYYKLRYRHGIAWLPRKIVAHAGDDALPDHPDDEAGPSSISSFDVDMGPVTREPDDPVDIVLDYILRYTDVDVAIACDGDIQDLVGDDEWPANLRDFLAHFLPRIDVEANEDGTTFGVLSVEDAIMRNHRRREDANNEAAVAQEAIIQAQLAEQTALLAAAADAQAQAQAAQAIAEGSGKCAEDEENGGDVQGGAEDDAPRAGDEEGFDIDRFNGPKEVPENLRRAAIVLENKKDARAIEWPHLLLYDNSAEGGSVTSLSLSKDGDHVAAGFEDNIIRVWALDTSLLTVRLAGHADSVWAISFSPTENTKLVSASGDQTAVVWDAERGDVMRTLAHDADLWSVCYAPDGKTLATGTIDGYVRVWDVEKGEILRSLRGSSGIVMYLAFSPDGRRLVSGSDSSNSVWDPSTGDELARKTGHDGTVWSMAFSPDGSRIITGAEDHTARIWDAENGDELVILREHNAAVWAVAWSPDSKKVALGSFNHNVTICDSYTGKRYHVLEQRVSVVNVVTWSGDGEYLASGSSDGVVRIWEDAKGEFVAALQGHRDKIRMLLFTPDGRQLLSSSDDGTVRVWSMSDILRL